MCQASAGGKAAPLVPLIGSTRARVEQKSLFYSSHAGHPFVQHFSTYPNVLTQFTCSHQKKKRANNGPGGDDWFLNLMPQYKTKDCVLLNVVFHVFILSRRSVMCLPVQSSYLHFNQHFIPQIVRGLKLKQRQ